MYTRKNDQPVAIRSALMGGKGDILCRSFLSNEDAAGTGRMFAVNTIQPGDSIGYHSHQGEFEVYYILKGTAQVVEDGKRYTLYEGDMMQCKSGSSHSIENIGSEPLEHLALILFCK